MSIEGQHAYRFGYLKSEEWKNVRLEALAREKGCCQICGEESISNDAHHVWYPENIYDTRAEQLVILCRCCHDFLHTMVPECKTNDAQTGRDCWLKFRNAIVAWRTAKANFMNDMPGRNSRVKNLREAYEKLRSVAKTREQELKQLKSKFGLPPDHVIELPKPEPKPRVAKYELKDVVKAITRWASFYNSVAQGHSSIEDSDYQI